MILPLVTIIILSITLNILFVIHLKKINVKHKLVESNKDSALEYIDALWKNQKDLIQDEKQASLNLLVSRIAHELNTPLGVAITAITYIQEKVNCSDISPMVNLTKLNLDKSITLVEKFTEISGGNFSNSSSKVNVELFMNYTINLIKSNIENCDNIEIKTDIDPDLWMNVSEVTLSVIIKNIIENAIHFSCKSIAKKVCISVSKFNKDLIFSIKDSGCGISKDDISKIYDPFYTTRRSDRHYGLGLSISNTLINRYYKGYIVCKSSRGMGTEFIITLPNTLCTSFLLANQI